MTESIQIGKLSQEDLAREIELRDKHIEVSEIEINKLKTELVKTKTRLSSFVVVWKLLSPGSKMSALAAMSFSGKRGSKKHAKHILQELKEVR